MMIIMFSPVRGEGVRGEGLVWVKWENWDFLFCHLPKYCKRQNIL